MSEEEKVEEVKEDSKKESIFDKVKDLATPEVKEKAKDVLEKLKDWISDEASIKDLEIPEDSSDTDDLDKALALGDRVNASLDEKLKVKQQRKEIGDKVLSLLLELGKVAVKILLPTPK